MEDIFFNISCEHLSLPTAEIKAILEAENIPFKYKFSPPCIFRVSMPLNAIKIVLNRSGMTFYGAKELLFCNAKYDEIFRSCKEIDWSFLLNKDFCVRIKRVLSSSLELSTRLLEREIGSIIYKSLSGSVNVNLNNPNTVICGILSGGYFVLGVLLGEVYRGSFYSRWVGIRPYVHPSSLNPIISRVFVNLSRAKCGGIFFDPFCGFGGFIIEANLIGCEVIGLDIDNKMIHGCRVNMNFYGFKNFHLILGDAKNLPFKSVDHVATDPPYGRTASTKKFNLINLFHKFLNDIYGILSKDGYLCLAAPHNIRLSDMGLSVGFKLVESHLMRVHKSLIREICVFKL